MSKPLKLTLGIGTALLILLIAVILFLRYLVTKSFPVTEGTLAVQEIYDEVHVYRDQFGVPHILAKNEHDMFLAVGYIHAQDRLWQLDLIRRAGQGRLSEIFGEKTVEFDKLFRTIGIARVAEEIERNLHPESKELLVAYADGINAFIRDNEKRLPVEFDMLNYRPEPWQVQHSIIVTRMIAWELSLAWFTDITFGIIAERVGPVKASEIIPVWQKNAPRIIAEYPGRLGEKFLDINSKFLAFMGIEGLQGGSNCWVIGPQKSSNGKPILANDVHLMMPVPARWYQLHISCPGWNVAGVSLPGTPLIVVGRNDAIAWGVTNAMVDDADFYVEKVDSSRSLYLFDGREYPIVTREDTIYVGKNDSVIVTINKTRHGPVIDRVHPLLKDSSTNFAQYALAMRWTGLEVSDEAYAFYLFNKAKNAAEFAAGIPYFMVPGQNVVFADTSGNIGYWTAARIPIRGKYNPMMPVPGWLAENDWKGFVPAQQLPKLWNPPEGFIATANNKITKDNYPYYISELWEPPSRIERIRELLSSTNQLTAEDFKRFQMDVLSPYGKEFVSYLLQACEHQTPNHPLANAALEYLRNWDFRFHRDDVPSSIVNATLVHFLRNVFEDEMGDTLFKQFVTFSAIPYRVASQLLARQTEGGFADSSSWFDDIRTPAIETKDEILRKSLYDALDELQTKFGSDTKLWRWGSLHTVTFSHPFGSRKPLDKVFNIGPFPVQGAASTICKMDFRISNPYVTTVGPSMRHVIDLGNTSTFSSVITSGESGQALHKHYDDQTVLWLNGSYHKMVMDWGTIQESKWERLTLRPK